MALIANADSPPVWQLGESLHYAEDIAGSRVELRLINQGDVHLAPEVTLRLTDALGREVRSEAGFGRWVLPGQSSALRFATNSLPPDTYQAVIELTPAVGSDSVQFSRQLIVP